MEANCRDCNGQLLVVLIQDGLKRRTATRRFLFLAAVKIFYCCHSFPDRNNLHAMATKFGKQDLSVDELCAVRMQKSCHFIKNACLKGGAQRVWPDKRSNLTFVGNINYRPGFRKFKVLCLQSSQSL